jgi:hypothetical protein
MTGQERHTPAVDLAEDQRVTRRAVRSLDRDLFRRVEELVETRTADDT